MGSLIFYFVAYFVAGALLAGCLIRRFWCDLQILKIDRQLLEIREKELELRKQQLETEGS